MIQKIAIYWGAFDPPQLAHETIIKEAIHKLWLNKLYIVPSWPHAFKEFKTSTENRKKIMEIFVDSIDSDKVELCDVFLDGKIKNTTLETDRYFKEKLWFSPYQIFGSDLIDSMWLWDPSGEVAMRLPKIIVKRPWFEINVLKIANFIIFDPFADANISELSSTQVRENIKKNIFTWMNPALALYIRENWIYL
ncbi:MAG: nicotinic acid mononucleotide adenylyltransferase [uncultured bacterium (gcode 4)]|uniref:nicotinate-nucleotide adenylyltransferase n=1 Tax=uncultured bacterium (gcode 4) TaxID=1234023 RepID=K2FXL3_9BACT|nr:MAG: nicotinic acid mononucleotide adenylyltransferase [uncultured bacterium (gcode 4)]